MLQLEKFGSIETSDLLLFELKGLKRANSEMAELPSAMIHLLDKNTRRTPRSRDLTQGSWEVSSR